MRKKEDFGTSDPLYHILNRIPPSLGRSDGPEFRGYRARSWNGRKPSKDASAYIEEFASERGPEILEILDGRQDTYWMQSVCESIPLGEQSEFVKGKGINRNSFSTILHRLVKGEMPRGYIAAAGVDFLLSQKERQEQEEAAKREGE